MFNLLPCSFIMNKEKDTSFLLGRVLIFYPASCGRGLKPLWRAVSNKIRSRCRDSLVSCGPKTDSCKKVCDFKNTRIRVQSRIYRLREKSRVAECHELLGGCRKFFEMNMRRDAVGCIQCIFETRLCRQRILTSCALTSSRLDDFSDIGTYMLQW